MAGLLVCALSPTGVVSATDSQTMPAKPQSGPVFAPFISTGDMSSSGLTSKVSGFLAPAATGSTITAEVQDATTSRVMLDSNAAQEMIPASTLKIVTAAAALAKLGATSRFNTTVVQAGNELTLVGGGDPTLTTHTARNWRGKPAGVEQPPSLDELAQMTANALSGNKGPYVVNVDASFFEGPTHAQSWASEYLASGYVSPISGLTVDFGVTSSGAALGDPVSYAAKYFVSALKDRGIDATYGSHKVAPNAATEVTHVQSATVVDIVERMLTTSNNTMAEFLAHHVGKLKGDSTFDRSAKAVEDAVSALGISTNGMKLYDGSGLSADDRVSARTLVDVLQAAQTSHPELWPIVSGLPIAGVSGTLAKRYSLHSVGRGYVRAKTGTLFGVVTLVGTTVDKAGDLVTFAVMANGVRSDAIEEKQLDAMVQTIAGCGCH